MINPLTPAPKSSGCGPNVSETLAEWLPLNARGLEPRDLAAIQPLVRFCVDQAAPRTLREGKGMLRETFAIMIWAFQELGTLRVELVFDPDIVESFVARNNGGRSISSQRDARRALTRIGRIVNPQSWPKTTESSAVLTGAAAGACGCQNRTGQDLVLFCVLLFRLLIGLVALAHENDGYTSSTHHHVTNVVIHPGYCAGSEYWSEYEDYGNRISEGGADFEAVFGGISHIGSDLGFVTTAAQ